jgi:hypothetical protein
MGWWIALGILVCLAVLPLGVDLLYHAQGFRAAIVAGPIRIPVFPLKEKNGSESSDHKEEKTQDVPAKNPPQKAAPAKAEQQGEKPGNWTDFLPLVQLALDLLGDFRRKLRINRLELNLIMAADDPCDLAVNYGRGWAALGNLVPLLERAFVIKKRDIRLQCDFTATEMKVNAHAVITITLGRLIALAVRYGIKGLREFLKIHNQRKGGATS